MVDAVGDAAAVYHLRGGGVGVPCSGDVPPDGEAYAAVNLAPSGEPEAEYPVEPPG